MSAGAVGPLGALAPVAPLSGAPDTLGFLEARRVLSRFEGGPELPFLFAMSGTHEPLAIYLDAACARRGRKARPAFLPFGTLGQFLATGASASGAEVILLFPWDFAPEADWRSGLPGARVDVAALMRQAEAVAGELARRAGARFLYVPAPIPPLAGYTFGDEALSRGLFGLAVRLGATVVRSDAFSLSSFLTSGCPIGGAWLGRVADLAVSALLTPPAAPRKLLVTDLDDTLWGGVVAESGPDGVAFGQDAAGYRHHIYQSLLKRLRSEGVLLAAVSRNDRAVVRPPLDGGSMPLSADDFVAICASYEAKSSQIRELATRMSIGLDAIVFVDDSLIEREEVRLAIPEVEVLAFPERDDELPAFLESLAGSFSQPSLTTEDRERTQLYRRRFDTLTPSSAKGADLTRFLTGLAMSLSIHNRTAGDRTRAVQLINKTNQFNANGRRWSDAEVGAVLAAGGRLLTASLSDRSGSHGEVIAFLMGPDQCVEAFVMSCRVFQRRAEHAFLASLVLHDVRPRGFRVATTERNEPFRQFTSGPAFGPGHEGVLSFDAATWVEAHRRHLDLFRVSWTGIGSTVATA